MKFMIRWKNPPRITKFFYLKTKCLDELTNSSTSSNGIITKSTLVQTNHPYLEKIKTNNIKLTKSKHKHNGYTFKLKVAKLANKHTTN